MYSSDFISAVNDLLVINADSSTIDSAMSTGTGYGLFDSQLFLFESCGIMLATGDLDDTTRMSLLQHLFNPLFSGAQRLMNSRSSEQILQDPRSLLQIHHYLTAIGSIIKGFPDVRVDSKTVTINSPHQLSPSTAQVFLKAADMCIAILEALRESHLIREAARFTLSRMLSVLGAEALPYLPRLIDSLVSSCAVEELSDVLGFLGLVVFKFKPQVAPTASTLLLPVISKVYGFLDQVAQGGATGTDELVLLQDLRKAYLTWVLAIFNSDLDSIFLVEQNAPHLVTIFQPIAGQLAADSTNHPCQRLAFAVLFKAIQAWMVDPMGWHTLTTLTPSAAAAITNAKDTANRVALRQAAAQALGLGPDSDGRHAESESRFSPGSADLAGSYVNTQGIEPPPNSLATQMPHLNQGLLGASRLANGGWNAPPNSLVSQSPHLNQGLLGASTGSSAGQGQGNLPTFSFVEEKTRGLANFNEMDEDMDTSKEAEEEVMFRME
ncbi:pre-tRNA nuclear export protein [Coemansia aciculifera]|uniref:Pre-tRNA nuclear export protein n=1 Tax=Coemansia aciculifera TaxID=417176 RepID=A0ACC1M338_9FUNG|nr:pre-tRNA nuclear export protein [Coemansia aciculifera]